MPVKPDAVLLATLFVVVPVTTSAWVRGTRKIVAVDVVILVVMLAAVWSGAFTGGGS